MIMPSGVDLRLCQKEKSLEITCHWQTHITGALGPSDFTRHLDNPRLNYFHFAIPSYASAFICSSPSDTRSCVAVEGKTVATDTDSQITRFLASVWMKNSNSDSPILGAFDLQRCENSGISAGKVECVFFSNATRHDEAVLNHIFRTSRLFVTVTDTRI